MNDLSDGSLARDPRCPADAHDANDAHDAHDAPDPGAVGDAVGSGNPAGAPSAAGADSADEASAVRERYARRTAQDFRYSLLNPAAMAAMQERQRALARLLVARRQTDVASLRLLEVGCGAGGNLLEMLRLGFDPAHLAGIELLPDRHAAARACLPAAVELHLGDAMAEAGAPIGPESVDIVYQATVFSSLLDDAFQQRLADRMWRWVRPGGAVLWYDFTVDNPRNPDVRGVGRDRVRALFPRAEARFQRITLAPPIARTVSRVHPGLYAVCNALPILRTHLLGWLAKRR